MDPLLCWYAWAALLFMWIVSNVSGGGFGVFSIDTHPLGGTGDDVDLVSTEHACIDRLDTVFMDVDDMYTAMPALTKDLGSDVLRGGVVEDLRFKLESTLHHLKAVYDCLENKQ